MGLRFRKSIKVAPGVKLNLNKKSVGITAGVKGAHYTINSKGKKTASVGIPGTGISYTSSSGGGTSSKTVQKQESTDTPKKNFGCLGIFLLILLVCLAFPFLPLIWIPAIPVLIYFFFSKKYRDKRKRNLSIGFIILVASFILFLFIDTNQITSLDVKCNKTTYDIHDIAELQLKAEPEAAEITELKISENDIASLTFKNGKATLKFKKTGQLDFYLTADGDVKSNTNTITVIDKAAEEAKKKAEEEAKKKAEEEAKKKAEEEAKKKAAEEQRLAEEEANKQAENQQQSQENVEEMVWISATGSKYHSRSNCGQMNPDNAWQTTRSEAEAMGYTACKRCH